MSQALRQRAVANDAQVMELSGAQSIPPQCETRAVFPLTRVTLVMFPVRDCCHSTIHPNTVKTKAATALSCFRCLQVWFPHHTTSLFELISLQVLLDISEFTSFCSRCLKEHQSVPLESIPTTTAAFLTVSPCPSLALPRRSCRRVLCNIPALQTNPHEFPLHPYLQRGCDSMSEPCHVVVFRSEQRPHTICWIVTF